MSEANAKVKERKAFVLLSGGLDSTTCLHKAIVDFSPDKDPHDTLTRIMSNREQAGEEAYDPITWVEAVSFLYGQRHLKETTYARITCRTHGIVQHHIDLGSILASPGTMLTDKSVEIPSVSYGDLPHGVSPTYVPYRNGTFLSVTTALAQKWINEDPDNREAGVYAGMHSEDAQNWAYPDCTPEFIGAQANAIWVGSYMKIRLYTPLQWLMKPDIIDLGESLCVDFADTWSCYKGDDLHCGVCPTCRSRREAFIAIGIKDPTEYAQ